jgi:hypothetical protein
MLLRRIVQHLRDQNWAAIGLDLIVVIVGVFLAFQVEQLYSERGLRADEYRHLLALKEDFQQTQMDLERLRDRYTSSRDSAHTLLEATASEDVSLSPGEFYKLLSDAFRFGRPAVVRRTWDVLTTGGEIGVIQSDSLKSQIAAFYTETDVVLGNYNELPGIWSNLDFYAMENFDYLEIVRQYHADELTGIKALESKLNISEVLTRPEFRDWLAFKWHLSHDFLVRFEGLLDRILQILTELDNELADRLG